MIIDYRYSPIMSEMEQDPDQNKTKAPSKGQIAATEKRNACESGLHQTSEIDETETDFGLS